MTEQIIKYHTQKPIIKYIKNLIINHKQLGADHFYFGEPYNLTVNDIKMPYIILQPLPYSITEQTINYKYRLIVMDIEDESLDNELDIVNDCTLIATDIINSLSYNDESFFFKKLNNYNVFSEKYDDFVGGVYIDIEFKAFRNNNLYEIPVQTTPTIATNILLTDLVSYYDFDEESGNLLDKNGTRDGVPNAIEYSAEGKINTSYSFNGSNTNYIVLDEDFESGVLDNNVSWSFWMNINGFKNYNTIFNYIKLGVTELDIVVNSAGKISFDDGRVFLNIDTRTITIGEWAHYVLTFEKNGSSSKSTIYINGVSGGEKTINYYPTAGGTFRKIGQHYADKWVHNGELDEMGIWNRVLDQDDVDALYNSGAGLSYNNFT